MFAGKVLAVTRVINFAKNRKLTIRTDYFNHVFAYMGLLLKSGNNIAYALSVILPVKKKDKNASVHSLSNFDNHHFMYDYKDYERRR
jgi:hypothetical protein